MLDEKKGPAGNKNGEKMSKSKGNVIEPWSVINTHGADALRWYFFSGLPGSCQGNKIEFCGINDICANGSRDILNSAGLFRRQNATRATPQLLGHYDGINILVGPPIFLIAGAVQ